MRIGVIRRKPHVEMGHPIWWHHHGSKMRVVYRDSADHRPKLFLEASAASVGISRDSARYRSPLWRVKWTVGFGHGFSSGDISVTGEELRAAFGLSEESGCFGDWLIERYGADSAEQGKYIRWGCFLNIPCPGTGHDGDPNVSIELDDTIKEAVDLLMREVI